MIIKNLKKSQEIDAMLKNKLTSMKNMKKDMWASWIQVRLHSFNHVPLRMMKTEILIMTVRIKIINYHFMHLVLEDEKRAYLNNENKIKVLLDNITRSLIEELTWLKEEKNLFKQIE